MTESQELLSGREFMKHIRLYIDKGSLEKISAFEGEYATREKILRARTTHYLDSIFEGNRTSKYQRAVK